VTYERKKQKRRTDHDDSTDTDHFSLDEATKDHIRTNIKVGYSERD
jgi:hypothetical protein